MQLLVSEATLTVFSCFMIADLIDRYQFKKKPGKPRRPIYDRSPAEVELLRATRDVRRAVKAGTSVKDAIDQVEAELNIGPNTLSSANKGKRGSAQRIKKLLSELKY